MMSAGLPSPSKTEEEDFHEEMKVLYASKRRFKRDDNNNLVKARLPEYLLIEFTKFRVKKGWDESTAIRFALHKLLKPSN